MPGQKKALFVKKLSHFKLFENIILFEFFYPTASCFKIEEYKTRSLNVQLVFSLASLFILA